MAGTMLKGHAINMLIVKVPRKGFACVKNKPKQHLNCITYGYFETRTVQALSFTSSPNMKTEKK